ncbi:penicillin-binding protein 1A [Bradyrhizobium sp. U87765 SZCCT0131]|uniref:penicillin-binding protein 1A n=1 Tax=unclassified Bradyrhizobium TaxID=2631580 RepID=UPI001BA8F8F2|nr:MULTISPECIES: penicillin-binding protein 1A [unclassified Bradyrhizobium]MBR1220360.1 penicillin-binding protein 1A [Bradyrhizobium sp. U87765 SZCCT0131]MBR1263185.1 penicillin-binding protein 1A [Bradyrhizobium sp. U87765 SZCCT0134]MBR1306932.1 penicillin-binding protein 1A [Bradyrhizobium sp. U87765 SZCCT0110]MBR1323431.1 penicillin-binding protein 1A [Bradyrhizobium sp. U87765 SZCCT0109]MBR1345886.1 penicillin-binding protein 1A [Bradyrhizobium sp. U87765 SZCCT0048]
MRLLLRFMGFLFAAGTIVFLVGVAAVAGLIWHYSKDLPDYSQLKDYEPPVMTRVHAADGALLAEYSKERRLYLPIQAIPKPVINAFLAAEDKNFYEHGGIDFSGLARAVVLYAQNLGSNRRPQGASTITQQVAKNFLLTNEVSFTRKIKEALLAMRIERAYAKDKILELYLNEIYLGMGAYGVAAASLVYFDKSVNELTVAEAAYLAALPKAPAALHPVRNRDRAIERRNYVIDRLLENGWIKQADADKARKDPLIVTNRANAAHIFAGEYFAEEVRRDILDRYGEKKLYEGGLSVRTTLNPTLQVQARRALTDGLVRYDENQGWRGAPHKIDISGDWGVKLAEVKSLSDISPWRMAVVLETSDQSARIGFQPGRELGGAVLKDRQTGLIALDGVRWARAASGPTRGKTPTAVSQVLSPGDVIYVDPLLAKDGSKVEGQYRLRQLPEVSGALVAMDPSTGRVQAMVGGFSFDQSQFNRATQAYRQPGSSFKPIVYSSALDNGYTPSTVVIDAPIEIDQGAGIGIWRPENYSTGKYYGPTTLRQALTRSLNTVTVRLAQDIGMPLIGEYAKRFGVYDELPNYLSYALGAGETTVMRMVTAYSMFDNGGKRIKPTLIDRIQDRYGRTIYRHDQRECRGCEADGWKNQAEPTLVDRREQVLDPMTAYQITSMMENVVQHGTAMVVREVGKPIAGKTGTTNDEKDAWFVGFSPDLVVGVYIGYDKPRNLGRNATGGALAAPVARDFLKMALAEKPAIPFRVPAGIKLIRVDPKTGTRVSPGSGGASILEAFKPGTAPPDNYSVIGVADADGRSVAVPPDADRAIIRPGTGGLY